MIHENYIKNLYSIKMVFFLQDIQTTSTVLITKKVFTQLLCTLLWINIILTKITQSKKNVAIKQFNVVIKFIRISLIIAKSVRIWVSFSGCNDIALESRPPRGCLFRTRPFCVG